MIEIRVRNPDGSLTIASADFAISHCGLFVQAEPCGADYVVRVIDREAKTLCVYTLRGNRLKFVAGEKARGGVFVSIVSGLLDMGVMR